MKALQGVEGQVEWLERAAPVCGDGQVRIRVVAAGLNRADLLQRAGHYPPPPGVTDILGPLFADKTLSPRLERSFPIGDVEAAFAALASNQVSGKVALVIDDSLE